MTEIDHSNSMIMYWLINLSLIAGTFFAFLLWLFQPLVLENPGLSAYQPPPATRLVHLPGKMDRTELTEISSARNLAVAPPHDNSSRQLVVRKSDARVAKAKKSGTRVAKIKPLQKIVPPSWYGERTFAYERQRTDERQHTGFRASSDRYRSWF